MAPNSARERRWKVPLVAPAQLQLVVTAGAAAVAGLAPTTAHVYYLPPSCILQSVSLNH